MMDEDMRACSVVGSDEQPLKIRGFWSIGRPPDLLEKSSEYSLLLGLGVPQNPMTMSFGVAHSPITASLNRPS
jgi:hypothetical protein